MSNRKGSQSPLRLRNSGRRSPRIRHMGVTDSNRTTQPIEGFRSKHEQLLTFQQCSNILKSAEKHDFPTLERALRGIEDFAQGGPDDVKTLNGSNVLDFMKKAMKHCSISQTPSFFELCIRAIAACYNASPQLKAKVEELKFHRNLISALETFSSNHILVQFVLEKLLLFVDSEVILDSLVENRDYQKLLKCLKSHGYGVQIQTFGLKVLARLLEKDYHASNKMVVDNDLEIISIPWRELSDYPKIENSVLEVLTALGKTNHQVQRGLHFPRTGHQTLLQLATDQGIVEELVTRLKERGSDVQFVQKALPALHALCLEVEDMEDMVGELPVRGRWSQKLIGLPNIVLTVLENFRGDTLIQITGLQLLSHLSALSGVFDAPQSGVKWLNAVEETMNAHKDILQVATSALDCLVKLLSNCPEVTKKITKTVKRFSNSWGSLEDLPTGPDIYYPIHELIKINLAVYSSSSHLYILCSKAIHLLLPIPTRRGVLLQCFLEKKTSYLLLQGLKQHHMCHPQPIKWGVKALRALTLNDGEEKKDLQYTVNVLQILCEVMSNNPEDSEVMTEVFATIACYGNEVTLLEKAAELQIPRKALECLEIPGCSRNPELCEVLLELLIILFTKGTQRKELINAFIEMDMPGKLSLIMDRHINSRGIQLKSFLLTCLLCNLDLFDKVSKEMCVLLARSLVKCLLEWSREKDMLRQGVYCLRMACHMSDNLSEGLVEGGIHLVLMHMLQMEQNEVEIDSESENGVLSEMVVDIICTLCTKDYRNQLLLAMVKDGFLEGVQILVDDLGADVDCERDGNTPICLAVEYKYKNIVKYLLSKVATINCLQRAIDLASRPNRRDDGIMGLLLAHWAQDNRGSKNDTLSLSGLGLPEVPSEWILPALGEVMEAFQDSLSSSKRGSIGSVFEALRRRSRHSISDMRLPLDELDRLKNLSPISQPNFGDDNGIVNRRRRKPGRSLTSPSLHLHILAPSTRSRHTSCLSPIIHSPKEHMYADTGPQSNEESLEIQAAHSSSSSMEELGGNHDYLQEVASDSPSPSPSSSIEDEVEEEVFEEITSQHNASVSGAILPDISDIKSSFTKYEDKAFLPVSPELIRRSVSQNKADHPNQESLDGNVSEYDGELSFLPSEGSTPSSRSSSRRTSCDTVEMSRYQHLLSLVIQRLDLSSNTLQSVDGLCNPSVLKRLRGLKSLSLNHNHLDNLSVTLFKELVNLELLDVSHNRLLTFPVAIFSCEKLCELDLTANQIGDILPPPKRMENLTLLRMGHNRLYEFPVWLNNDNFPQLTKVCLENNDIMILPKEPINLKNIQELNLSRNNIKEIPMEFMRGLVALRRFNISNNHLEVFPDSGVAGYLDRLEFLRVDMNKLESNEATFYNFVTELPNLTKLIAAGNGLTSLAAPWRWESRALTLLDLASNKIEALDLKSANIYWPVLEHLNISNNQISSVPPELGLLKTLMHLKLSQNKKISKLPVELGNLKKLLEFPVEGCDLDPNFVDSTLKQKIAHLQAQLNKTVPQYRMKLMFVGASKRGKTTLMNCILNGSTINQKSRKKPSAQNISTVGVTVKEWVYPWKHGVEYHLSCWDFAGQEDFYSTHQCFLTPRSVYILVYDFSQGASELASIIPWLLNIYARAPESPVIVVGTHRDTVPNDGYWPRSQEIRKKIRHFTRKPGFPSKIHIHELSCVQPKMGMKEVIDIVKEVIDEAKLRKQKIMGAPVPASYLVLADILKKEAQLMASSPFPVLSSSRLKWLMTEKGLIQKMTPEDLDQAIQFLHDSGFLLHYNDTYSKLSEMYFLNPEWLCQLMGKVITIPEINPALKTRKGMLHYEDLKFLLRPPIYPSEYMEEYIRLLERFEVAMKLQDEQLIIPSHLQDCKPNFKIPQRDCTIRRYDMSYIPPGFWPRLTTRLIMFSLSILSKPVESQHIWNSGLYAFWSHDAFCLINEPSEPEYVLDITVPFTTEGSKLLCSIVDNIEALIDEWFPGLRLNDVTCGQQLVKPYAKCPHCPLGDGHLFYIKDLIALSSHSEEAECPVHKSKVPLQQLAPDIVVSDLHPSYKLNSEELNLTESSASLLGKGGYGQVYKGFYRGKPVAVKVFSQKIAEFNNSSPNQLIRQEVSILSQLNHPNIIKLEGVCLRPKPLLVLEYAEFRSLQNVNLASFSLLLKRSVAAQIASGLAYLHKKQIIYRDLKPDNILIFSININAPVNAKISDYGIACFATAGGLMVNAGTPGSKAPEQLKARHTKTPYDKKVDIYTYGLVLFYLLTDGHKPFEEIKNAFERDKIVEEGHAIPYIEKYGCPSWPDMQELLNQCVQYNPKDRPTAEEICSVLCKVDLLNLKKVIPNQKDLSIDTCTIRIFKEDKQAVVTETKATPPPEPDPTSPQQSSSGDWLTRRNGLAEVWMASQLDSDTVISTVNVSLKGTQPVGKVIQGYVVVMTTLSHRYLALGMQNGIILIYDAHERQISHKLTQLDVEIVSMTMYKIHSKESCLCAGLANGEIILFPLSVLQNNSVQGFRHQLSESKEPVSMMKSIHRKLYVCSGHTITIIKVRSCDTYELCKSLSLCNTSASKSLESIYRLEVSSDEKQLWASHRNSPAIQVWDVEQEKCRGVLSCDEVVQKQFSDGGEASRNICQERHYRVTAMLLQSAPGSPPYLWVGLASGHMIIFNVITRMPLIIVQRHIADIRAILEFKANVTGKEYNMVITSGFGFRPLGKDSKSTVDGSYQNCGSLLVWDSSMPKWANVLAEDAKKFQLQLNN